MMRLRAGPLFGILLLVSPAMAQDDDRVELKGVVGTSGFLDSPTDYHAVVGGAARLYISPRFALEPEFTYMRASSRRQDYAIQMGVIWQFRRGAVLEPYLVAAAGVQHSRSRFPGAVQETFSSNAFTGGGGVGIRIGVGSRFRLSPEFRVGSEPIVRATVSLGYMFH